MPRQRRTRYRTGESVALVSSSHRSRTPSPEQVLSSSPWRPTDIFIRRRQCSPDGDHIITRVVHEEARRTTFETRRRYSSQQSDQSRGRRDWSAIPADRLPPILNGRLPDPDALLPAHDPQMRAYAHVGSRSIQDAPARGQVENMDDWDEIWVVTEGGGPNGEHRFTIESLGVLRARDRGFLRACRSPSQLGRFYWWIPRSQQ